MGGGLYSNLGHLHIGSLFSKYLNGIKIKVFDLYNLLCALSETWLHIIWNGEQEMDF